MLGPDAGQSAVEVAFDGADGEVDDGGDLGEFEVLDEAEDEDGALALGELGDGLPDEWTCSLAIMRDSVELPGVGSGRRCRRDRWRSRRRASRSGSAGCGCGRGGG